ncbi:ABC transporter [uncultured Microbacterium sp.]|uniref:ABC transporter n=1 Tax=uncultured Microbacterium sp. TaxID=191216 RepID=UPI002629BB39|nr:ABC transporter [uncultured Microbacterium sp.]
MSDPEVPQPEQPGDVNDVVDSANAGLAEAEAARGDVPAPEESVEAETVVEPVSEEAAAQEPESIAAVVEEPSPVEAPSPAETQAPEIDPDLAAFEEAERLHPGTFAPADAAPEQPSEPVPAPVDEPSVAPTEGIASAPEASIADTAYLPPVTPDAPTALVPSEPVAVEPTPVVVPEETDFSALPLSQQPIFVQAPEPPRDRGNRGTAGAIGLLAAVSFAILYLGAMLGFGALTGDVTFENIGDAALSALTTWGLWVPVVVFFLGFWFLGSIINRGRWGLWVVFGIIVGVFAYAGHILGQLFEAPFWFITPRQGAELVSAEMLAPLAIAAFVFGRELTIWFGAWVARIGARKSALNAEDQLEYERTLEAGPTLPR